MVRPGAVLFPTHVFVITSAFMALIGAFVLTQLNLLGAGQHFVMAVLLATGAIALKRKRAVTWLIAGLAISALLALVEAVAYTAQLQSADRRMYRTKSGPRAAATATATA